jgi:2'-hydroxyisoflavone reductase
MNRRDFVSTALFFTAASACAPLLPKNVFASVVPRRILVLGGTLFLGPQIVEAALSAGHHVTIFNRGITNPDLFPHLEKLRGRRSPKVEEQDLTALARGEWDAVVDVWPHEPTLVASAAELLKDRTRHYLYVSSGAAYDDAEFSKSGIIESAPLAAWDSHANAYSRGKAECERRLQAIIGQRLTIVRPGAIKGLRDDTADLLTWLLRAQAGGEHIGPGDGTDPIELVDVKDIARFLVMAINQPLYGTFNLTGPVMTFPQFLEACNNATDSDAEFIWIPLHFLRQHGLETDTALHTLVGNFPLWRPVRKGLMQINSQKAYQAGWRLRPFEETARDCLEDFYERHFLDRPTFLSPTKEKEVIDAWARMARLTGTSSVKIVRNWH